MAACAALVGYAAAVAGYAYGRRPFVTRLVRAAETAATLAVHAALLPVATPSQPVGTPTGSIPWNGNSGALSDKPGWQSGRPHSAVVSASPWDRDELSCAAASSGVKLEARFVKLEERFVGVKLEARFVKLEARFVGVKLEGAVPRMAAAAAAAAAGLMPAYASALKDAPWWALKDARGAVKGTAAAIGSEARRPKAPLPTLIIDATTGGCAGGMPNAGPTTAPATAPVTAPKATVSTWLSPRCSHACVVLGIEPLRGGSHAASEHPPKPLTVGSPRTALAPADRGEGAKIGE